MSLNYGNFDGPSRSGITTTGAAVAFRFAKNVTTAKEATLFAPAGNAEQTFGIFMDAAAVGDPVSVAFGGIGRLCVDGNAAAIAAGDYLDSDAAGKGTKIATDQANYGAIALDPSTADGDIIRVFIAPPGSERSTA
jgi:hypothetical protein